jgi:hypothetical protein
MDKYRISNNMRLFHEAFHDARVLVVHSFFQTPRYLVKFLF